METYQQATAFHYAAYRPPLHQAILQRALPADSRFEHGVDVGSGTGYSALALAAYCRRVSGVEPSEAMRQAAQPHPAVSYLAGRADALPLADGSADILTLAGVLPYARSDARSDASAAELRRVGRVGATLLVYDFEVLLDETLARLQLAEPPRADYDHAANLDGYPGFEREDGRQRRIALTMSAEQLAHVLLSSSLRYPALAARYGNSQPFAPLWTELAGQGGEHALPVDIYYSRYRLT